MGLDWLNGGAPRIAYIGDSWLSSGNTSINAITNALGGTIAVNAAVPSTGYVRTTEGRVPYTDPGRIKQVTDSNPNLVILFGSVNDHWIIDQDGGSAARIETAAKQVLSAIREKLPKVPIIVTGQQESSAYRNRAAQTVANQNALLNAVNASGPGVAFVDQIGINAGVPQIFNAGTRYTIGQVVHYAGANYKVRSDWTPGAILPTDPSAPVDRVSLLLTGTGSEADKKGDGNRDDYLMADLTHLTAAGVEPYSQALGKLIEKAVNTLRDWVVPQTPPAGKSPAVIRSRAFATAASGSGTNLSAESHPGDTAILVMSAQLQTDTALPIPEGWTGVESRTIPGTTRSGYIAKRKITDPSQTQNVAWFDRRSAWTARQVGYLLVLSNVGEIDLDGGWQQDKPEINADSIVVSQSHGPAQNTPQQWTADEIVWEGTDSITPGQSWSNMRVARTTTTPVDGTGQSTAAWVSFKLTLPPGVVPGLIAFSRWYNGQEETATKAGVMPTGCLTAEALAAKRDSIIAHRGGSQAWPEHTERAYTNAMAYGCDALEFSAARTSDGVWFGCHDQSLQRLGGPATPCDQMTWAQVEAAMKDTQYMPARLDWLLETYGKSTTIVFDPKYAVGTYVNEYRDILSPWKNSVIIKSLGDAAWLFDMLKNDGFWTWAYSYNGSTSLGWWNNYVNSAAIDFYSVQFDATQEVWNALRPKNKPIISHISASADHIAQGKAGGATGTITARPDLTTHIKV